MYEERKYKLYVGKFSPTTLPLDRLAGYAAALSKLLGSKKGVTFDGLEKGSTQLLARVDFSSSAEVEKHVSEQLKNPEASEAIREINRLLRRDKTSGHLVDPKGAEIIAFPGINQPEEFNSPSFRETVAIFGQLVRIGGTDESVHATLIDISDDDRRFNVTMDREAAKEIAQHLFGPVLRLDGSARFKREKGGNWNMTQFDLISFQVSEEKTLLESIEDLRALQAKGLSGEDAYRALSDENGEESVH